MVVYFSDHQCADLYLGATSEILGVYYSDLSAVFREYRNGTQGYGPYRVQQAGNLYRLVRQSAVEESIPVVILHPKAEHQAQPALEAFCQRPRMVCSEIFSNASFSKQVSNRIPALLYRHHQSVLDNIRGQQPVAGAYKRSRVRIHRPKLRLQLPGEAVVETLKTRALALRKIDTVLFHKTVYEYPGSRGRQKCPGGLR